MGSKIVSCRFCSTFTIKSISFLYCIAFSLLSVYHPSPLPFSFLFFLFPLPFSLPSLFFPSLTNHTSRLKADLRDHDPFPARGQPGSPPAGVSQPRILQHALLQEGHGRQELLPGPLQVPHEHRLPRGMGALFRESWLRLGPLRGSLRQVRACRS